MKKQPMVYELYVEGGLSDQIVNRKEALRRAKEARKEGWNVRLVEVYPTVIGDIGREVR